FGFKFSSRPHPRKFAQKRFLAVRRSWRGNGVACFELPPWKKYRRRARDHVVPKRMDAAVCRAAVCYPCGRQHRRHRVVSRREFIPLLGGVATWPLGAWGQQAAKVVRLGYFAPARFPSLIDALRAGLRDFGYVEGQNLAIEYRFALGQAKSYDELAQEL